ncbi:glycosyltransferase, partial [Fusobacterium varium]
RDILKDGECGVLFEVGNEEELADNIEKILKNQELKKEYEKLIKERVKEFDSKNVMKEYEKLIEEI